MSISPLLPRTFKDSLKSSPYQLALPESMDPRILHVFSYFLENKIIDRIINFAHQDEFMAAAKDHPKSQTLLKSEIVSAINLIDLKELENFIELKFKKKKNKVFTSKDVKTKSLDPLVQAGYMLTKSVVDSAVAVAVSTTADVLRAALLTVGLSPQSKTISGSFVLERDHEVLFFADCGICISPTPSQIIDIAHDTYKTAKALFPKKKHQIAFLSFSTKGSARHPDTESTIEAFNQFKERYPEITCDGELQFDAAYLPTVRSKKAPDSPLDDSANIYIFPDLNSGNIAYKITQRLGGFHAYGPILQGLNKSYCDLSRGSTVDDIISSCYISLLRNSALQ